MSGNKLTYYLIVVLILVVEGCALLQPATEKPVVQQPKPRIDTPSVGAIDTIIDTVETPVIDLKKAYDIAILLPFSIDQAYIDSFDLDRRTTNYRPQIALELYEGMLLALQDLDSLGIDLTVHVHDTKNRLSEIEFLLAMRDMAEVDMIFGPLFPQNLRTVAAVTRDQDIWLVSPYASYAQLDSAHDHYLNYHPSLWAHQRQMADFLSQQATNSQVLILHSGNEADKQHANNLLAQLEAYSPFTEVPPGIIIEADASGMYDSTYLSADADNWVVVTSYNEVFINNCLRVLGDQVKRYPIHLMGMPGWLSNYESLRLDYLKDLDYHFTEGLVIDTSSVQYRHVDSTYRVQYGFRPSENTLRGYELLYTHVLLMVQDQLPPDLFDPPMVQRISTGIQYIGQTEPSLSVSGTSNRRGPDAIAYYVNGKVSVFRYRDWHIVELGKE